MQLFWPLQLLLAVAHDDWPLQLLMLPQCTIAPPILSSFAIEPDCDAQPVANMEATAVAISVPFIDIFMCVLRLGWKKAREALPAAHLLFEQARSGYSCHRFFWTRAV